MLVSASDATVAQAARACASLSDAAQLVWGAPEPGLDDLLPLVDDVLPADTPPASVRMRLDALLRHVERRRAEARRDELLRAVLGMAETLPGSVDAETFVRQAAGSLLALPGVLGVYLELAPGDHLVGEPAVEVGLRATPAPEVRNGTLVDGAPRIVELGEHRIEFFALGAPPRGLLGLRFASGVPRRSVAVELLVGILARGLTSAAQHVALQARLARLERATGERQRLLARTSRRLEQLTHARDEFVSMLGHDVRNPLMVVLGHCQMLEEGTLPARHRARSIETIRRQAERLGEMFDQALERQHAEPEPLLAPARGDLGELARDVIGALAPAAARVGSKFVLADVLSSPVEGDLPALRTALATVLQHVLVHSPESSDARVAVQGDTSEVRLHVTPARPLDLSDAKALHEPHRVFADWGGALRTDGGGLVLTLPRAPPLGSPRQVYVVGAGPGGLDELMDHLGASWDVSSVARSADLVPAARRAPPAALVLDARTDVDAGLASLVWLKDDAELGSLPVVFVCPEGRADVAERATGAGACATLLGAHAVALDTAVRGAARLAGGRSVERPTFDLLTGLYSAQSLEARMHRLVQAAVAAGRPLPVLVISQVAPDEGDPIFAWTLENALALHVAAALRRRAKPGDVLARLAPDAYALVAPGRTLAELFGVESDLREHLEGARPRLGVNRVAVRLDIKVVDAAFPGGDSVQGLINGARTVTEAEDAS